MQVTRCRICDSSASAGEFRVREMMFGTRAVFLYRQCARCGCLQIVDPPDDLSRFYPPNYYAHSPLPPRAGIRGALRRARNRFAFGDETLTGRIMHALQPYPHGAVREWFARTGTTRASRILDVGCGAGDLIRDLGAEGFRGAVGVDPYVVGDIDLGHGARVLRRGVHEVEGRFDLVMFHHSLEHIPDQREALAAAAGLLAPGGFCLVRVPTVSSYAWERYREHWMQLDAPRHQCLHSRESLRLAADAAGLEVVDVRDDSTALQFTGSEMYLRDIPLVEPGRHFTRGEIRRFRRRAAELNREGRGDQAAFYLRRR